MSNIFSLRVEIGIILIILGIIIFLHDLLYHLGKAPSIGKGVYVRIKGRKIHMHHAYLGIILMIIGTIVLLM